MHLRRDNSALRYSQSECLLKGLTLNIEESSTPDRACKWVERERERDPRYWYKGSNPTIFLAPRWKVIISLATKSFWMIARQCHQIEHTLIQRHDKATVVYTLDSRRKCEDTTKQRLMYSLPHLETTVDFSSASSLRCHRQATSPDIGNINHSQTLRSQCV